MPPLFLPPISVRTHLIPLRPHKMPSTTPSSPAPTRPKPATTTSALSIDPSTTSSTRPLRIYYTPKFKHHIPPYSHPECPARLDACEKALKSCEQLSSLLEWRQPKPVDDARMEVITPHIHAVHRFPDYLDRLKSLSARASPLDMDTYLSNDSYDIAILAASTWLEAVDHVLDDAAHADADVDAEAGEQPRAAWALTRPPGHHATPASGQGFCLLSNAAIAARYGVEKGLKVAILDFDVHHGNGTEAFVKRCDQITFVSAHQWPLYPGSGVETMDPKPNIKNFNFPEGTDMAVYRERYESEMLPFLLRDDPDLVVVSAGFDALESDPLGGLALQPADFRELVDLLVDQLPNGKFVFGLEGGYHLGEGGIGEAIRECALGFCCPR